MAYPLPSLPDLWARIKSLTVAAIPGAAPDVAQNTFAVWGKVMTLLGQDYHLRIKALYDGQFASTAPRDRLLRHGSELGLYIIPATAAAGVATAACTPGLPVPAGLQFRRNDGATFTTSAAVTPAASTASLPLLADVAGLASNTSAGEVLTLVSPAAFPSLGPLATIAAAGLGGGADVEDIEVFRQRVLDRKRSIPGGGSAADWIRWAKSAGATSVFVDVFSNDCRTVWLAPLIASRPNGIPTAGDVAAIQALVSNPAQRPVTSQVAVVQIAGDAVNLALTGLVPDTVAIRAGIAIEFAAMFADRVFPSTPSTPFTLPVNFIDEAVGLTPGLVRFTRVSPVADITQAVGHMAVPGVVSFV